MRRLASLMAAGAFALGAWFAPALVHAPEARADGPAPLDNTGESDDLLGRLLGVPPALLEVAGAVGAAPAEAQTSPALPPSRSPGDLAPAPALTISEPATDALPARPNPLLEQLTADVLPSTTQPVAELAAPLVAGIADAASPLVDPVLEAASPLADPVLEAATPLVEPVIDGTLPLVAPVVDTATTVLHPVLEAVPIHDRAAEAGIPAPGPPLGLTVPEPAPDPSPAAGRAPATDARTRASTSVPTVADPPHSAPAGTPPRTLAPGINADAPTVGTAPPASLSASAIARHSTSRRSTSAPPNAEYPAVAPGQGTPADSTAAGWRIAIALRVGAVATGEIAPSAPSVSAVAALAGSLALGIALLGSPRCSRVWLVPASRAIAPEVPPA